MNLVAFKGFDNVEVLSVMKDGVPFDLAVAGFDSAKVVVGDQVVEGTINGSDINVTLGDLNLNPGRYEGKLVIFSAIYPDGVVIAGSGLPESFNVTVKC